MSLIVRPEHRSPAQDEDGEGDEDEDDDIAISRWKRGMAVIMIIKILRMARMMVMMIAGMMIVNDDV